MTPTRRIAPLLAAALLLTSCGGDGPADVQEAAARDLTGTLTVVEGTCAADGTRSGSFFRMVQPGGTQEEGPFVANADSPCADKTFTPLKPGTEGGLTLAAYQPQPEPPFAGNDGAAGAILAPTSFFAVKFAVATNESDPQTGTQTNLPVVLVDDQGSLSGDLSAFGVAWNGQHFNQGAPKPGGERPGLTAGPTGTYDEGTGAYSITWSSQIVGGPFDNFTGMWHLEGTVEQA